MSTGKELATSKTNPPLDTRVQAKVPPEPLYFLRPETNEIYYCPRKSASAVLGEAALLDELLGNLSDARVKTGELQAAPKVDQAALEAALKKEKEARDKLFEELNKLKEFNKGGDGLMELLQLPNQKGASYKGKTITYVRSDKVKNHFRAYKLAKAQQPEMKSFLVRDEQTGKYKLDEKKLKESFKPTAQEFRKQVKIESKLSDVTIAKWADEWVPEFARSFNDTVKFEPDAPKTPEEEAERMVEFSGNASLCRFFGVAEAKAGAKMTGSLKDVLKGKGSVEGSYKARADFGFALASGRIGMNLYLPDKGGFNACIPVMGGADQPLGAFRLLIEAELSGNVGASVMAEGGVEFKIGVDAKGNRRQGIRGAPVQRNGGAMRSRRFDVSKHADVNNSAGVELTAFAGAEATATVGGSFDWQKPESKTFATFASIKPSLTGQAGAGATAAFKIDYDSKKKLFHIHCKVGACWGLGLKGALNAAVGPIEIAEFALWFHYQVVNAAGRNLAYFAESAWSAYCHMQALAILEGKRLADYLGRSIEDLTAQLNDWVRNRSAELVVVLLKSWDKLVVALAEIKGFLLALLRRARDEAIKAGLDAREYLENLFSAVQIVTDSIYLENEYRNVLQHSSLVLCEKSNPSDIEGFIAEVMGPMRVAELQALKTEATPGYYVVSNRSPRYGMQQGVHVAWNDNAWWNDRNGTMLA